MRLLRLVLLLFLVALVLTLTIALSTAATGVAEKIVLTGVIALCVYLAARVPTLVTRLQARWEGH